MDIPNTNKSFEGRKRARFPIMAVVLLAGMAVLAGGAALRESVTVDEVAHIGAGLSYWQKFDIRMNEEHPPLAKMWATLPLAIRGTRADYSHISWTFSERRFFGAYMGQWIFGAWVLNRWNDPVKTLAWARFPMVLLMLALGWIVFAIGRRLGGRWGGLLCLAIYASSPVFLAFGPLAHTDIPVTLFTVLALWMFGEIWREPGGREPFLFGLCLAGAILSKFTAGIMFFAFAIFAFTTRWWPVFGQPASKPERRAWRRLRWRATLKGIGWASAIVYIFYFIFSIRQTTDILDFVGHGPAFTPLRRLLMPVWLVLRGLFWVILTASRPTFILGKSYPHGVWFYYPIVFLLKSPLGFLGLLLLAILISESRKKLTTTAAIPTEAQVHWRVLWISLIVFTVVCMLGRLDISIRHFSVPLTLIMLMLAPLPNMLEQLSERSRRLSMAGTALVVILTASCLVVAVRAYPFYFPYINSLSMGRPSYAVMNDSNVDWNQSIPEVRRFVETRGLKKIALDWYGLTDSTLDVPGAYIWDCEQPSSGDAGEWAAISSNLVYDSRNCAWLLNYPHENVAGGAMIAVHLPEQIPPAGAVGGPPRAGDYHPFFGAPFDIRSSLIDLIRNPDKLPAAYEQMMRTFKQQQAQSKK